MKSPILLSALIVAALIGCKGAEPEAPKSETTKPVVTTETKPAPLAVPESLKTAAYEYYGLGGGKSLTYAVSAIKNVPASTMTQTDSLTEATDDSATFEIKRETTISGFGGETVTLDAKGVSTTKTEAGEMSGPSLELPADVAVGKAWDSSVTITSPSQTVESKSSYRATKTEKIKVQAGEFDCLVIEGDVTIRVIEAGNTSPRTLKNKSIQHFAKGVGLVKMTLTGPATNVMMELTKVEG